MKTLTRDFSKFHGDNFIGDLKSVNWPLATQNNPNIRFGNSMLAINNLLDKITLLRNKPKERQN